MKITKETFKNIVREVMTEESEYQDFFKRALEKTGKSIPDMSDEEKKSFFNKIDAAWQGKGEKNEELVGNQAKLDVDGDGEIEASDLAALRAGKKVDEATTSSAPGEWVAYLSMTRGKKLLKTFNTARGAKQFLSKNVDKLLGGSNVESVGLMTKKQWDEREAKYAIEGVNEASKPTIKVVNKLKNEQGIQIVVVKTTKGETEYGGFVVRGKLQKVIPVGANKTKEDVKKRALQIWNEFGKQLGESIKEAFRDGTASHFNSELTKWAKKYNVKFDYKFKEKGKKSIPYFIIYVDSDDMNNTQTIELNKLTRSFHVDYRPIGKTLVVESINEAGTPIDFKWPKGNTSKEIEKLEAEYKALIEKGSDILEKQKQLIRKEPLTGEYPWENYDKWPTKLKVEVEKLNLELEKNHAKTTEMGKKLFKLKGFNR